MAILLPAYEESAVIEQSLSSVLEADYPDEKLQLYVLTEPDDDETGAVLETLSGTYDFVEITVPEGYPGDSTKPRALNYGFEQSGESLVGVVDAEDIVEPGLFREAATRLVAGGSDYVQARLDMANEDDGWLNTLFRADYSYWYRAILPAFHEAGYPVPLGGTSCFFHRSLLREMSERRFEEYGNTWDDSEWDWIRDHDMEGLRPWDPNNVTEDFELGLFLWKEGKSFSYLDSVTTEESPLSLDGWIRQRTRWKKGKLYTFFQYRETPPDGWRAKWHLFMQSMLPHMGPINILGIVIVMMVANIAGFGPNSVVAGGELLALGFAVGACTLHGVKYWGVSGQDRRTKLRRTVTVTLTLPIYWILQWGADLRALVQTYSGNSDEWELTEHFGRHIDGGGSDHRPERNVTRPRVSLSVGQLYVGLTAVVFVGLTARLYHLTEWSLSGAEIYATTVRAAAAVPESLVAPTDLQPPLYYVVLYVWTDLLGTGEVAVRLLSVLFAVAAIIAIFLLGAHLYDDLTGLVAALLLSVSAAHVHFSRTAGPYSLFVLLTILSWYYFTRLNENDRAVRTGYVLSTVAVVYVHLLGIAVLLAQWTYVALTERADVVSTGDWRRLQGVIGLLSLPWLAVLGERLVLAKPSGLAPFPHPSTSLNQFRETVLTFAGHPSFYPVETGNILTWSVAGTVTVLFAVGIVLAILTFEVDDTVRYLLVDGTQAAGLTSLLLFAFVGALLLSVFVKSLMAPRYVIAAIVPLYVLVGRGITNLRDRRWQSLVVGALVLSSLVVGAFYYSGQTSENWRSVGDQVELEASQGDLLVVQPAGIRPAFEYYYDGPELQVRNLPESSAVGSTDTERLERQIREHERVWIVRYREGRGGAVPEVLQRVDRPRSVRTFGAITVYAIDSS